MAVRRMREPRAPEPSQESKEDLSSVEKVKAWAEQRYKKFKGPATHWISMTMLALTTEGCASVGKALSYATMDPAAAQVNPRIGLQPSMPIGLDPEAQKMGGFAGIGIETIPLQPGDDQWWRKEEGVYNAQEVKELQEAKDAGTADSKQKARLRAIKSGDVPGYLRYKPLIEPKPTQTIAIVHQQEVRKRRGDFQIDKNKKTVEPIQETMLRGLVMIMRNMNPESGVRVVPHVEKRMKDGGGWDESVSLRFEEIATIVSIGANTPEQEFIRDAFATNGQGEALLSSDSNKTEKGQSATFVRLGAQQLADVTKEMKEIEASLPYLGDIHALQKKVRDGSASDADVEQLVKYERAFNAWKSGLSQYDTGVEAKEGKIQISARRAFTMKKIWPLESELNNLRMSIASDQAARPIKQGPDRDDEWAKQTVRRLRAVEIEGELAKLYVERNAIPEDKKEEVDGTSFTAKEGFDTKKAKAEKASREALSGMIKNWEQLLATRDLAIKKLRDMGISDMAMKMGITSPQPTRFHVRVDEVNGYLALIAVTEKR